MKITVDEFKTGIDRYLEEGDGEELLITKDGKVVAVLSRQSDDMAAFVDSIRGTLPQHITDEEARAERLAKHENRL